ncbi:MAG: molybdenum cofactor biosynthesis protein MoaE [Candidatus Bathyarchaeia archaeon]|jgi:molybdopterin synthase catalytic subunit
MSKRAGVHHKGTFSLLDMINNAKKEPSFKKAGAITLFIGIVREEAKKGEKVEKLQLEAYEEKANQTLAEICDDLRKKPGVTDVEIHHMLGEFSPGEDLVYVLVAGSHRQNIFPILQEAVERYKREAPIFKKEHVITQKGEKKAYWLPEKNNRSP